MIMWNRKLHCDNAAREIKRELQLVEAEQRQVQVEIEEQNREMAAFEEEFFDGWYENADPIEQAIDLNDFSAVQNHIITARNKFGCYEKGLWTRAGRWVTICPECWSTKPARRHCSQPTACDTCNYEYGSYYDDDLDERIF
jgi:hypothetical protein